MAGRGTEPIRPVGSARMTVKIGIGLFTGQLPEGSGRTFAQEYRETLDLVRLAEAVGFDSAWVSEHHGSSDGYLPSLLAMLAAFAAVTERIELGTGLVLTPLHDPIRLAEDAAVVDQLSGGRLRLGLGLGWREEEFRMFAVPLEERVIRLLETIEVLKRAWTGQRFSFQGKTFRYERVLVTPPPARPVGPPILLGGYHERALRRAGRLADGYMTDDTAPDSLQPSLALVDEGARAVGRDPRALEIVLFQNAFVQSEGDAWATIRDGAMHQWGAYTSWDEGHDAPDHDSLEPQADEEEVRGASPAGTAEDVIRALRPTVEALADRRLHLVVRLHYPGMDFEAAARAVELFAEEVIPALKGG